MKFIKNKEKPKKKQNKIKYEEGSRNQCRRGMSDSHGTTYHITATQSPCYWANKKLGQKIETGTLHEARCGWVGALLPSDWSEAKIGARGV